MFKKMLEKKDEREVVSLWKECWKECFDEVPKKSDELLFIFNRVALKSFSVISASTTASTTPERGGIIRLPPPHTAIAAQGPDSGSWRSASENQVKLEYL